MGAFDYFLYVVKNYFVFSGRARRKEYWFYTLFYAIFSIILTIVEKMLGLTVGMYQIGILSTLFGLALLLPGLGVLARRLHDIDKSAWWILIGFVPLIGPIILIIFACIKGTEGPNRFGEDPVVD